LKDTTPKAASDPVDHLRHAEIRSVMARMTPDARAKAERAEQAA
jgi:hypothetical protein